MLFETVDIPLTPIEEDVVYVKDVTLHVLRLDQLHSIVSGNKIFKLHYYIREALDQPHKTIITFGGAYSNHLVATAFACRKEGLKSIGIVRGEEPVIYSHTLLKCREYGMKLHFISREDYREKPMFIEGLLHKYGNAVVVPEGGYGKEGMAGAELIHEYIPAETTHICCAMGTGTTLAGLLFGRKEHQNLVGIPVLKGFTEAEENIKELTGFFNPQHITLFHQYHFGGYAKKDEPLLNFMRSLWEKHKLPTDFVYTGKMMYAVYDLLTKNYFPPKSHILCIHTGGLQGNLSLPVESLPY